MSKAVFTKYQPSVTEWFYAIGKLRDSQEFRREDNSKAERQEFLYQTIGLPYERPVKFSARQLKEKDRKFSNFMHKRGKDLCAIRLVPKDKTLPKLRLRGLNLQKCYQTWFLKQKIDYDKYDAHIYPHSATLPWSTIFIVNKTGIFGEIIKGMHSQLTHGETENQSFYFLYNYKKWFWSKENESVQKNIKRIIELFKVENGKKQRLLERKFKIKLVHQYIPGYFEAVIWPGNKIFCIDFNRILSRYFATPPANLLNLNKNKSSVSGLSVFPGKVRGNVVKVNINKRIKFPQRSILVCDNTDIRYLPYMRRAGAIITNRGGMLSHAAIISRELKIPCVVNTKTATKTLKTGDLVEVDANKGIVRKIK